MKEQSLHVKFNNQKNPQAKLDIVRIEDLMQRDDLDHNPCKLHLVEFYLIIIIENGKGVHTIDFTDYDCKQGSILTIRKDQLHKFSKSNLKGYLLLFTDEFLAHYLEQLEVLKTLQLFNELLGHPVTQLDEGETAEIAAILNRMQQEYANLDDPYALEILRSELHILITKLYRIKSNKELIISKKQYLNEFVVFQNLIEEHVSTTIRVKDYAHMMACSTKTLNNISKSIINKTAKEFIDEISLKQIKRLLVNTNNSVKEIAYLSGFEETTNFYKYFKRLTQTTPEQYRISMQIPITTI